jgi:Flp pilus assembly protein TadB
VIAIPLLLGTGLGAGILLIIASATAQATPSAGAPGRALTQVLAERFPHVGARSAGAAFGALLAALLTRWPVGVVAGLAIGFFARDLFTSRAQQRHQTDRTEAIASWTEMLRDTMAAAAGLEQAIITTAPLVPQPIRPEIAALVTRLQRERLGPALAAFGDDLADPTADLVVSALTLAASGEAQELGELLASLAAAARDSATMRLRVDATRARTRTSVRIITAVTVGMALLLVVLNRTYLAPFNSATGQMVLLAVFACFGGAFVWLASMARYIAPERFLARPTGHMDAPWS